MIIESSRFRLYTIGMCMKEIFDIINHLTENLALGQLTAAPSRVSGGLMHKMYRVETTHGCYAVKHLNPEIMSRPTAKGNFARAEALETRLTEAGLPVVAALSFHGRKMQELQGNYFYVFPWQEGHITDFHHISADQCEKAGQILGKMHAIACSDTIASCDTVALCNTEVTAASGPGSSGKTESEKALSENPETPCETDFSQYLAAAEKKNTCLGRPS